MKKRPTQSRKGVKGGFPLAGSRGGAPLWGLGQRPNRSTGDQFKGRSQPRRRQRSVPASNFARPQTRPPSRSTQQLCRVAPDGRDRTAGLSDIAALFCKQGISPLRRRPKGNENRRSLRSPFGNLRGAHPCLLTFIEAGRIAPAGATRGISNRSLSPFGAATLVRVPCLVLTAAKISLCT